MKISKSKQELARIISENGGWCDGAGWSSQDRNGSVTFFVDKPWLCGDVWEPDSFECVSGFGYHHKLPNWHQTILSRDEYFHLYPAPDADADCWIEWSGGKRPVEDNAIIDIRFRAASEESGVDADWDWEHSGRGGDIIAYRLHKPEQAGATDKLSSEAVSDAKIALMSDSIEGLVRKPTIEQLAADYRNLLGFALRKQQEADDAKADADERLRVLELAGEALGLVLSVATKPVFTGKFHSAKHGDSPRSLDVICDGCGKRFGNHVGFDCRP